MSLDTIKSCLLPYIAVGWTGYVPINVRKHPITYSGKIRSLYVGIFKQISKQDGERLTQE